MEEGSQDGGQLTGQPAPTEGVVDWEGTFPTGTIIFIKKDGSTDAMRQRFEVVNLAGELLTLRRLDD